MKKLKITERDYITANRKASREEEIARHSHPVGFARIHESKRSYNRKKIKQAVKRALSTLSRD